MTGTAIEKATEHGVQVIDKETVRKFICANATDNEIGLFLEIAKAYELNPFKREVYLVKYGSYPASTIVGYETYLKRAERTGKLDGWDVEIDGEPPEASATITIHRKDRSHAIKWTAYYEDAVQRTKDGGVTSMWRKWKFMLRKVAIAQGMRLAFPDELGGLPYTEEELDPTQPPTNVVVIDSQPLAEKIRGATPKSEVRAEVREEDPCTPDDRRRLFGVCKVNGYEEEDVRAATCNILQNPNGSTKSLTVGQVNSLCAMAEAKELPTGPLNTEADEQPGTEDDDIPFGKPAAEAEAAFSGKATKGKKTNAADPGEAPGASGAVSGKAALGRYVAQARVDAGVAPAILAKAIGVTPAVLSGLEKGQVAFTREQALAAAKCLNLHPDDVLAIGGFAVESDNPQGNQHGDGSESSGKDSQGGFKLTR
jgi:phage recombination protein Bet